MSKPRNPIRIDNPTEGIKVVMTRKINLDTYEIDSDELGLPYILFPGESGEFEEGEVIETIEIINKDTKQIVLNILAGLDDLTGDVSNTIALIAKAVWERAQLKNVH